MEPGVLIIFIIFLSPLALMIYFDIKKKTDMNLAKDIYQNALKNLEKDPENNDLRKYALDKGRDFALKARKAAGQNGIAIFDEMMLSNDINMRLGHGTGSHSKVNNINLAVSQSTAKEEETPSKKIENLKKLLDIGAISEKEFESKKEELLKKM